MTHAEIVRKVLKMLMSQKFGDFYETEFFDMTNEEALVKIEELLKLNGS